MNSKQTLAVFSAATDSEHKISSNTTQKRTKQNLVSFLLLGKEPTFKCISPAYKRTFISVNHIICNIGCLKQTGKYFAVILILSIFIFQIFKCKKMEFHEKMREKDI